MASEACPGCGGEFPALSGPQHPYMESSSGCPWPRGQITVATLIGIDEPERHVETARRWAGEVWQAWSPYHTTIRQWTNDLGL